MWGKYHHVNACVGRVWGMYGGQIHVGDNVCRHNNKKVTQGMAAGMGKVRHTGKVGRINKKAVAVVVGVGLSAPSGKAGVCEKCVCTAGGCVCACGSASNWVAGRHVR